MGKARNIADLLDANGDVKSANLDNVPPSNDASALTTGTLSVDRIANGSITDNKLSTDISAKVDKISWNHSAGTVGTFNEDADIGTIQVGAVSGVNGAAMTCTSSDIPSGLSLSSSGALTGALSNILTTTTSSFTVSVTDGTNTDSRTFSITNTADNDAPVWNTAAGALAITTGAYSEQLSATDPEGGSLTYSLQSGSLPPGLSLSTSGLISGTATTLDGSTSSFTVRVSDGTTVVDRSFSIMAGVTSKTFYSYGASSNYTSGWNDTTVTAASTNYVTYNSDNFYLYNVGSNNTWMGVYTRLHSSGTFAIPSYHTKLKMYVYIDVKDSNNQDTGGEIRVKLGSSHRGSEYLNASMNSQIGTNDGFYTTLSADIPASARGQNVYYTIESNGGQHCNVRFNVYTIKSFVS